MRLFLSWIKSLRVKFFRILVESRVMMDLLNAYADHSLYISITLLVVNFSHEKMFRVLHPKRDLFFEIRYFRINLRLSVYVDLHTRYLP
jgi:hypothetical protein